MYKIEIEHECKCFKESSFENNIVFENREDMLNRAKVMECLMNQEFCMKHYFRAVDYGDKVVIHSELRDEDEDDEDVRELVRNSPVVIGFSDSNPSPNGSHGCCGKSKYD